MKCTLCFFMLVFISPKIVFAQANEYDDQVDQMLQSFLAEREKMMKEVEKMFEGKRSDLLGSSFSDDFFNIHNFDRSGFVSIQQKEEGQNIAILITPKNKNINLNIETKEGFINVKSAGESHSFQRSIGIPRGYKALDPIQEDKVIKILLVPLVKKKVIKSTDKVPVERRRDEDVI